MLFKGRRFIEHLSSIIEYPSRKADLNTWADEALLRFPEKCNARFRKVALQDVNLLTIGFPRNAC